MNPVTGPPKHLHERIEHLATLMKNLPDHLPLNPPAHESTYHFGVDPNDVEERGPLGAVSHVLEVAFGQRVDGIIEFKERGSRLSQDLPKMMKIAVKEMSPTDREAFKDAWLERLIVMAKRQGASTSKRKNNEEIESTEVPVAKKGRFIISEDKNDTPEIVETTSAHLSPSSMPPKSAAPSRSTKQTTLSFQKDTRSEAEKAEERARNMRVADKARERWEAQKLKEKDTKAEREREQARVRQQRHRHKLKAEKSANPVEPNVNDALMKVATSMTRVGDPSQAEIATTSRAGYEEWREERNGKKGGAVQGQVERINWHHAFLWPLIEEAMIQADWSPAGAERILKLRYPQLFRHIHRQIIGKWKKVGQRAWTERTLLSISNRHALVASGQVGALARSMEVVEIIKKTITDLRKSGMVVNVTIARSIMLAIIREKAPNLLDGKFQCSERFVRDFLQSALGYSPRKGTRAAAHLPADADDHCERAFFRLVYGMFFDNIPSKLVVNVDQMGIYVLPNSATTWHTKGDKQIDIIAKDEKRAYTLLVASTPNSDFLPFQQVWAGKTAKSRPDHNAPGIEKAKEYGFHFASAASETNPTSHYSTLKSMKEWVDEIYQPYVKETIAVDPDLDADQKSILFIDAYPVHTSEAFRTWMYEKHPNTIVLYVPQNCTGKFQPADVGLQRPIKHFVKQELFNWMATEHQKKIKTGLSPEDITVTTSIPQLRNASVMPIVKAYEWMKSPAGRDLIKKAWAKSCAKSYNLSSECLTSRSSQSAMREYLKTDHALYKEIEKRCGKVLGIDSGKPVETDLDMNGEDDGDIPISDVIKDMYGETVAGVSREEFGLVNALDEENVWAYDNQGVLWLDPERTPTEDEGDIEVVAQ